MKYSIIILLIIFLTGCTKDSRKIGFESIQNLSDNYKCTGILEDIKTYQYFESVINNSGLEIQLWNRYNQFHERTRIIVFIFKNKGYAIPLLPNQYMKYWNFQVDNVQADTSKINTTFENELTKMIESLKLEDSVRMTSNSLGSLFLRLMQCRVVYESDLNEIVKKSIECNDPMNDLKNNESKLLIAKINSLSTKMKKGKIYAHFNAAWDEIDHRIYQLNLDSLAFSRKFHPCLKIYQLDRDCSHNITE